jgi:acyl carrier protein
MPVTSDLTSIKETVRGYILENTSADMSKLKSESLIFKEGYFDSMGFVMLITFLEEKFGVKTVDADLVEENFESINAISDFIIKKLH